MGCAGEPITLTQFSVAHPWTHRAMTGPDSSDFDFDAGLSQAHRVGRWRPESDVKNAYGGGAFGSGWVEESGGGGEKPADYETHWRVVPQTGADDAAWTPASPAAGPFTPRLSLLPLSSGPRPQGEASVVAATARRGPKRGRPRASMAGTSGRGARALLAILGTSGPVVRAQGGTAGSGPGVGRLGTAGLPSKSATSPTATRPSATTASRTGMEVPTEDKC